MKKLILNIIRRICGTTLLKDIFLAELYSETQKIHDKLNEQHERNQNQFAAIYDLQMALFNGMQNKSDDIIIPTLDNPPRSLRIERTSDGGVCFQKPIENLSLRPPVFVITLPKSGTYFLEKIFTHLKYQNAGFHADYPTRDSLGLGDSRTVDFDSFGMSKIVQYNVTPFMQTMLVQPGQFVAGHLPFYWNNHLYSRVKICSIRDLRVALVSLMRFRQKRDQVSGGWMRLGNTEEALYQFIQSRERPFMFGAAEEMAKWVQAYPETVVRFEDLITNDKENNASIQNLSAILNVDKDAIISALNESTGKQTPTFSGKLSSIDDIWSDRVEEIFAEYGGVELNKALGYN